MVRDKMEVAVFGTGYVYQKYRNRIPVSICCLVDNAPAKQGTAIDGIRVISPDELCGYDYTYIVVMTFGYEEIEQQLLQMGVPAEKILNYTHISSIRNDYPQVHVNGAMEHFEEWLGKMRQKKKILLVSHDYSYSGVPVALLNMALVLKKMGYAVMMAGLTGGNFTGELEKNGIDYCEELNICYGTEWFGNIAAGFEYIIAGTLVLNKFVHRCSSLPVRILWWLHESDRSMYDGINISWLTSNIEIYGVGRRVIHLFRALYEGRDIGMLPYCIPMVKSINPAAHADDQKFVFAMIGTICSRKAQDIAVDAVKYIPRQYRGSFRLLIIGPPSGIEHAYCEEIENENTAIEEIEMLGELDQGHIGQIYGRIDVLLCPSRDDPLPIAVTQAMMYGIPCIISDNVGQSEYIRQGENGFIFGSENIRELAEKMVWVMQHKSMLRQIGERSKVIYEEWFSAETMERNIAGIFNRWDERSK